MNAAIRIARLVMAGLFLAAAIAKIADPAYFALEVHHFRLAPAWSENLVAITLPWIELVAAVVLLAGPRRRPGAMVIAVLMAAFTLAVAAAWARGLDFRCGCFGKLDASRVGAAKFAENLVLTAIALLAARRARGRWLGDP